jgi:hypothetical protein
MEIPMAVAVATRSLPERALEVLRRVGNPFRNYFARNPDDEVCARYHVPELFARERDQLLGVVDLYRYDPTTHSEVVPVLGNKGAGKTHLLHSIKHGSDGNWATEAWQLLVTPGVYQKDTDFLEYLLFQLIDTLLGGGKQKGARPLEFVSEELVRGLLCSALTALTPSERLDLFPAPGLGRWTKRLGLGGSQAQERTQWLLDSLGKAAGASLNSAMRQGGAIRHACGEAGLDLAKACELVCQHAEKTAAHSSAGLMRRHIYQGFARGALLGDEADLANFLTFGFAELDFQVRPTRQDLVLSLFKTLMDIFRGLKIPIVVAFDQLEDLLLARRTDDSHRVAEAFFAGIVQAMHQIDGICFLVFAERGLWNRFVPSLDGYIQDRLSNPVHVPQHGTIKTLRLEAPAPDLVRRIVEARLRPALEELPDFADLPSIYPFTDEQITRIAKTEPTLRDMLQQFRHQFDRVVYGEGSVSPLTDPSHRASEYVPVPVPDAPTSNRLAPISQPPTVKSVIMVETPAASGPSVGPVGHGHGHVNGKTLDLTERWEQELRSARSQLEPEGALTGATRELQAGLGAFLQICHEHGVKVGPWRLQHVVGEWTFGEHPTYGAVTIAHWVCKDGQPWKVGIGLFLGRGPAKPKDLAIKLSSLEVEPAVIDHLILLRPEDDLALTGKSKTLWQEAEKRGRHARLEAARLDVFAVLYAFPRFLACVTEALPQAQALPNLADLLQEKCERLLEQVCMPVQGG